MDTLQSSDSSQTTLIHNLRNSLSCEVLDDRLSLGIYATDASMYQFQPKCVVIPKTRQDILITLAICAQTKTPVIPRAGGTGLAGQPIGEGVVIDVSKFMTRILELNIEDQWVKVEPGIVRDTLNAILAPHEIYFAPDPATSNRANVSGMIANNAAGMRSIKHGMTIDHVIEVEFALPTGEVLTLGTVDREIFDEKCHQTDREGEIYRKLRDIIETHRDEIIQRYPKTIRRSGGYPLDQFIGPYPWNLAKLIVSSEGTLGFILSAKLNLIKLPKATGICLAHFNSMETCLRSVAPIVEFKPSAVELIDGFIINLAKQNLLTKETCERWIEGEPAAVLSIEAQGDTVDEVRNTLESIASSLTSENKAYATPIKLDARSITAINQMRSNALGLMTTVKGDRKPVPYIEDAAVSPDQLPEYALEVLEICRKYQQPVSLFAHASVGLLHIRPMHDLHLASDIQSMAQIQNEVFEHVVKHHGAWSGEHGDGIIRSRYNERFFGPKLYSAFRELKNTFDPLWLMNPGKIVDALPFDQNLRFGQDYHIKPFESMFHYREDGGGFRQAVEQCTGVGECRKTQGVMCPSYIATRDELHSTRGRGNALRLAMSGQLGQYGIASKEVDEALDLCLACKGCQKECPNNVDMARLKSEALYHRRKLFGTSLRSWMFATSADSAKWCSGIQSRLINFGLGLAPVKWAFDIFLGIDRRRQMPRYATQKLTSWIARRQKKKKMSPSSQKPTVVLFDDTYIEHYQPEIGRAAIETLEAAGYDVKLIRVGDSRRPEISKGFLEVAKKKGTHLLQKLEPFARKGLPILVCEPSCFSSLRNDLPDLCDDEALGQCIAKQVYMVDDFLFEELKAARAQLKWKSKQQPIKFLFHGHCHQKALTGTSGTRGLLEMIPGGEVVDSNAGCCGMSGAFGYEKEHYEISLKVAQDRLLPALHESPDAIVVANGFSCRHQIADLSGRKAGHVMEIVRQFIEYTN